jgi:hypothetical protein
VTVRSDESDIGAEHTFFGLTCSAGAAHPRRWMGCGGALQGCSWRSARILRSILRLGNCSWCRAVPQSLRLLSMLTRWMWLYDATARCREREVCLQLDEFVMGG